jgi:hypothetical protein
VCVCVYIAGFKSKEGGITVSPYDDTSRPCHVCMCVSLFVRSSASYNHRKCKDKTKLKITAEEERQIIGK